MKVKSKKKYKKKSTNKCIECVLSVPLTEKIGCLRDGERYYFIVNGKQRRCIPRDPNIRKCQQTVLKHGGDGNSRKRKSPSNNNLPRMQNGE